MGKSKNSGSFGLRCDSFNPDGAPARWVAARAEDRPLRRRWLRVSEFQII